MMMNLERIRPDELHPLENPLILENIFKHCSLKELKPFRLVSKLWWHNSLKKWRSSLGIIITLRPPPGLRSRPTMSEFLDFVDREENNHYSEAPYRDFLLDQDNPLFWHVCGAHVKILELWEVKFRSVDAFRNVMYKCCPNMQRLTIRYINIFRDKKPCVTEPREYEEPKFGENRNLRTINLVLLCEEFPVSWMELLSHFPCLDSINLRAMSRNHDDLFRSARIIRSDPTKLKLKHITTECVRPFFQIPEGLLYLLLDPSLQIKRLSIQVNGENGRLKLPEIFKNHSGSLKNLELQRNDNEELLHPYDCISNTTQLTNLQELALYCQFFQSMLFLKFMPNLKKLVYFNGCSRAIKNTNLADMEGVSLESFEELELHWEGLEVEDLRKFATWLPNVKKLTMPLNNEQFGVVCEKWPNLVILGINDSQVGDQGITGLELEDVKRINEEAENCTWNWKPITVPRANITALKSLKILTISPCSNHPTSNLGYCAALYGIQQVPNLKHLSIKCPHLEHEIWNSLQARYPSSS